MGGDKTTNKTSGTQQSTQQATQTEEEKRLNQLELQRAEATQGGLISAQNQSLNLINQLLTGQSLPGYLGNLPGGISEEMTSDIARQSVNDIRPSFQSSGILDSGVAAQISGRVAGDVRRGSAEFNMGNLLNLLNLAVGGQAQVQAPILNQSANLGSRLSGLRSISSTGSSTGRSTMIGMNPFLNSFQQSAGRNLGNPSFTAGPFSFGG